MRIALPLLVLALAIVAVAALPAQSEDDEMPPQGPPMDPAAQERIKEMTTPGPEHEAMSYFLGTWDLAITLTMPGPDGKPMNQPMGKATATIDWAIDDRWLGQRIEGNLMGQPYEAFSLHGYENHRKCFVTTVVSNWDTSMSIFRGVKVDPEGKVFTEYGTIYEYLDGTYDKPVKSVTRKVDADHFTMQVWDLQIGAEGAPVLFYEYTRRK